MIKQRVLYIIMGASGSGKTTLMQHVVNDCHLCDAATKYSSRKKRPDEIDTKGNIMRDDIIQLMQIDLERKCDVLYEINNNKYGVNTFEIIQQLNKTKKGVVLILSDIRVIRLLKNKVENAGHLVKVIYLLSRLDSTSDFVKTWQKRIIDSGEIDAMQTENVYGNIKDTINDFLINELDISNLIVKTNELSDKLVGLLPQSDSSRKRTEKIRLMFSQYVHNIDLFDYVILNTTTKEDMFEQAKNIIKHNNDLDKQRLPKHELLKGPVVFVVCASPKSGKGTLMENLNIMGVSQIQITPKYASRNSSENDKRDGMIAKGPLEFEKLFENQSKESYWEWMFHSDAKTGSGTKYAVKHEDIMERLNKGVCQIFVSNFNQLERTFNKDDVSLQKFLSDIKSRLVFVYLHRVRTESEIIEQVVDEKRQIEVSEAHKNYVKNIAKIDHVIINPNHLTYSEDLHDQIMSLIELYQN